MPVLTVIDEMLATVDRLFEGKGKIKVLEAGCGFTQYVKIKNETCVVGLDVSRKQLERVTYLDEKIHGDVENYDFPDSEFDMVVCWNVLEHLRNPEKALRNFLKTIKENGLIVLAFPNLFSIKGLVAKFTPHYFHILFYRFFMGYKDAGKDENAPFKTFFRTSMSLPAINKFARNNNLSVEYVRSYEGKFKRLRKRVYGIIWLMNALSTIFKVLSFGKLNLFFTDCIVVLRKNEATG